MSSSRLRTLVDHFVVQLEEAFKEELLEAIGHVGLGAVGGARRSAAAPVANGHPTSRGKGAKRDPAALEALSAKFVNFVGKHPGLRIEQINKQLGTTTKDLALPIRKAIASKEVRTEGQKRSTTYFPGGGGKRRKK